MSDAPEGVYERLWDVMELLKEIRDLLTEQALEIREQKAKRQQLNDAAEQFASVFYPKKP